MKTKKEKKRKNKKSEKTPHANEIATILTKNAF